VAGVGKDVKEKSSRGVFTGMTAIICINEENKRNARFT